MSVVQMSCLGKKVDNFDSKESKNFIITRKV